MLNIQYDLQNIFMRIEQEVNNNEARINNLECQLWSLRDQIEQLIEEKRVVQKQLEDSQRVIDLTE